jgi:protein tyrosine/serine phosphatase
MSRHRRPLVACALLLAVLAAVGFGYRQHKRYKHLAVHDPGMVYRSAWLESDVFAELIEEHQIRTILNLCEPDELGPERCIDQRRAVKGAGARLIELAFPPTLDAADPVVAQVVEILNEPSNFPLLVHCQHGVTRTAKVLVIYDILHRGLTAEASLKAMPLFGRREYNVAVQAFAKDFEARHRELYPQSAGRLDALRR